MEAISNSKTANYYFRIRTVYNEQGEIESCYYGTIYRDIRFSKKSNKYSFDYHLNPTPNDRNVEGGSIIKLK